MGRLTMTAPLGVELEVADARFRPVRSGPSPIELDLRQGLYNLSWHAGGRSEDRMVRIRAGQSVQEHGGEFPLGSAPPSAAQAASPLEHSQFLGVVKAVALGGSSAGAEILVVVRSSNDRPVAELARSVRLTDWRGERVQRSQSPAVGGRGERGQLDIRRYVVDPGPHVLGYEGSDRRRLEQMVHAFAGRQTIAYLKYGSLMIAEQSPAGVGLKPRRGIDPTETTLVSIPLDRAGTSGLEQGARLADIMLHKLAAGEPIRDEALLDELKRTGADPFLRIYGAALLAADRREVDLIQRRSDASLLLEDLGPSPVPDATCIRWRLEGSGAVGALLEFPPMLDVCWRWASEHSVREPGAISRGPMLTAAARVTEPTPPWLVWPTSAKSAHGADEGSRRSASEVALLTRQIVDAVIGATGKRSSTVQDRRLASLSPATVEYANAAMSVLTGGDIPDGSEIARRLAYSTGTPSLELAPQLGEALEELRGVGSG